MAEGAASPYRAELTVPLLSLVELDAYDGKGSFAEFAHRRATRSISMTGIAADDPVAVQAVGRDLSLGLPGSLQVLVADRRPEG